MWCRDSSGCRLDGDGKKTVLGFINLLPRLKQLVDQFMKSNRAAVVLAEKILRKIIGCILGFIAVKQCRD